MYFKTRLFKYKVVSLDTQSSLEFIRAAPGKIVPSGGKSMEMELIHQGASGGHHPAFSTLLAFQRQTADDRKVKLLRQYIDPKDI